MPRQGAASRRDIPREIRSHRVRWTLGVSRGGWPRPRLRERGDFFTLLKYSRGRLPQAATGKQVAATSRTPFATPPCPEVGSVVLGGASCGKPVFICSECVMTHILTNRSSIAEMYGACSAAECTRDGRTLPGEFLPRTTQNTRAFRKASSTLLQLRNYTQVQLSLSVAPRQELAK